MSADVISIEFARRRRMVREESARRLAVIIGDEAAKRGRSERLRRLLDAVPWPPEGGDAA